MQISVLGTGNMASGLATLFAGAGHEVTISGRDAAKAESVAATLGNGIKAASFADAAAADIAILAVPHEAAASSIEAAGGLDGKIVIDITNPMKADFSGLTIGHNTSAAEDIQKSAPGVRLVKAFNTVLAQVLQNGGKTAGQPVTVFVASDDAEARASVSALVKEAGLKVIDTGALATARYLEPVAALNITLGYGLGHGTDIAPTWQGIA